MKMLLKDCKFDNNDDMLRDKLVLFTNDRYSQDKWIKKSNVNLDEAIETLRIEEITKKQANDIHGKWM